MLGVEVEMDRKGWDCMLYSNSVLGPVKNVKRYKELYVRPWYVLIERMRGRLFRLIGMVS